MAIEFHFQFDPAQIHFADPGSGFHQQVSNRAVYRCRDGLLYTLGQAAPGTPSSAQPDPHQFCTAELFEPAGEHLPLEIQALEQLTRLLHRQSQAARPLAHFLTKLVDGFDYHLTLPGYETFPEARRQALEQQLQAHLRLRRLLINGQAVHIPLWRRNLEFWLRRVLLWVLPFIALIAGYFKMPASIASSPLPFLIYLLGISYGGHYAGKLLWMGLVRRFLPADYRLCILQGSRSQISAIDRFLAKSLWGMAPATKAPRQA